MASRKYGVVYTPNRLAQFVAELLLDEMHLDKMQIKSILDPACGECALLNAVEKLAGNAIQYYGIDVDKDVLNGNYENKKIIINDSILPKNVRQNTEIYWRKRVNRIQAIIANPPWSSEKIYDREYMKPVIRASICTGEQVAGFKDIQTGKLEEIMLIKSPKDLDDFKKMYGITEEIEKEY